MVPIAVAAESDAPERRRRWLVRGGTVVDAAGVRATPGVVLFDGARVAAAGDPSAIGAVADATIVERPTAAIVPAFANAHAHLDLTHVGPLPPTEDFIAWIARIRDVRATDDAAIAASVAAGVRLSEVGGVAAVGDVAGFGSAVPHRVLAASALRGVSYREAIGTGSRAEAAAAGLAAVRAEAAAGGVAAGVSPHAPYSCSPQVFRAAIASGRPMATHLAETAAELELLEAGTGPFAEFLRGLGLWEPAMTEGPDAIAGIGLHPVDALVQWTGRGANSPNRGDGSGSGGDGDRGETRDRGQHGLPIVAAHANHLRSDDPARLAAAGIAVAYCPRANHGLGHDRPPSPPHPWRALRAAGVTVALGTDSIVCLDRADRLTVFDDMRWLVERDGAAPDVVLEMGTTAAATAIGMDAADFTFGGGAAAGVLALTPAGDRSPGEAAPGDPWAAALRGDAAIAWLSGPWGRRAVPAGDRADGDPTSADEPSRGR